MEKVKIKEITKQIRGVSYGGNDSVDFPKEGYLPIMRSNNINDGILNFDKLVYVPNRFVKNTQLLKKGDILITASTGSMKVIGKNAPVLEDFNGSFGAFCKVVRPQKTVNSNYLKHFFQSNYYKRTIQSVVNGANINNIKNEHIDHLEIPLPNLSTQQRIATILDQADAIIQNNRAIVQKYDALTQSLFLDMFGDPVKNEKGWEVFKLSQLSDITSSRRIFKDEYVDNGIPFYRTKEIVELSKNKKITSELYISVERYNEIKSSNNIPQIGDILLSAVGTIGVMWIVNNDNPFYFKDGNLIWLKMAKSKNINSKYLIMTLEYLIEFEKGNLAQGAAYNALTIDKLMQFFFQNLLQTQSFQALHHSHQTHL
jgi:type I restriction enzyme S subunit